MSDIEVNSISKYIEFVEDNVDFSFITRGERKLYKTPLIARRIREFIKENNVVYKEFYHAVENELNDAQKSDFKAFAQHHHIATDLLDMSESPLVSLYFATLQENNEQSNNEPGWVFTFSKENNIDIGRFIKRPSWNFMKEFIKFDDELIMYLLDNLKKGFYNNPRYYERHLFLCIREISSKLRENVFEILNKYRNYSKNQNKDIKLFVKFIEDYCLWLANYATIRDEIVKDYYEYICTNNKPLSINSAEDYLIFNEDRLLDYERLGLIEIVNYMVNSDLEKSNFNDLLESYKKEKQAIKKFDKNNFYFYLKCSNTNFRDCEKKNFELLFKWVNGKSESMENFQRVLNLYCRLISWFELYKTKYLEWNELYKNKIRISLESSLKVCLETWNDFIPVETMGKDAYEHWAKMLVNDCVSNKEDNLLNKYFDEVKVKTKEYFLKEMISKINTDKQIHDTLFNNDFEVISNIWDKITRDDWTLWTKNKKSETISILTNVFLEYNNVKWNKYKINDVLRKFSKNIVELHNWEISENIHDYFANCFPRVILEMRPGTKDKIFTILSDVLKWQKDRVISVDDRYISRVLENFKNFENKNKNNSIFIWELILYCKYVELIYTRNNLLFKKAKETSNSKDFRKEHIHDASLNRLIPFQFPWIFIYRPSFTLKRIRHQNSVFAYQPNLLVLNNYIIYQEIVPEEKIKVKNCSQIQKCLDSLNINQKYINADFDSIASYLNEKYTMKNCSL